ncbi:MAG: DNA-binding response regulator [Stygiobacter sp. RIFOXYC12_FULL_38_8]|nr:MAG: response regulator [Stygiobacter sp.]KAF0215577.1 MAG: response [Ignavibacteria bacterium]OGU66689.1 MAG: DNA-binding response regulator [Stygiobacter sp. GWC2_38_9]OGV09047.1 MAG: DNA-binding response regulator [Stygiobacter sp. RIFOXYB2_FULL_37_11]OGV14138.1 MAG: DNA-binding response regulator [Stygiobacter sp. RIFOXYA2_FULL_38_8]OGV16273.1 MAG: DNA-binding response regulator [Stygiobacter sp. RIFOXYC2_FULL_38_25]OGV28626.1 MAG: DNA-binding response regulator [Stygiobacter sp. RIFOX
MNVLIADDHSIVREGLKQIVMKMDEVSNVEEARDGHEALTKIEQSNYDLVILDISMPGLSGLDILKTIKDREEKENVLILSVHPQEQYAIRAFNLGASGYLCKYSVTEELAVAIKKIAGGGRYITPVLAEKIIFDEKNGISKLPHEKLSQREFQIMCMLAKGRSVKEIARELFLSDKTISTYRTRVLEKTGLKNNAELTHYAIKNDLIE